MTKIYIKLIAMSLALILSVSVVLMSSYAWLVLSGNPAVTGIQVAIGGGNTILTAPNIRLTGDEGKIYNIPGRFSDKMNFGQQDSYAYLQDVGNLNPVSTSNGIDWFLPAYYDGNDPEVQQGKVLSGTLKDVSAFLVDSELSYANLSKTKDQSKINKGNYIYLDFWVVSPGGDYTLRLSTGDGTDSGGSFVIDLLEPSTTENTLVEAEGSAASTVRIGFLANDLMLTDETMQQYIASRYYDHRFKALRGMYQEPNSGTPYLDADRFIIYEPNGDYHPENEELDGAYVQTKSLELVNKTIQEVEKNHNLTVQRKSTWSEPETGTANTALEQRYQTAIFARLGETRTKTEWMDYFYGKYLQGQMSTLVDKGKFIKRTSDLNAMLESQNGVISAEILNRSQSGVTGEVYISQSGATEDVYIIKLERNIPQRIRMFIWLEGQDIDCVDDVSSSRFAVNIELAGGDQ